MSMSDSDTEMVKPVSGHNTFYEQVLWVGKWNLHSSSFVWIISYTELFSVLQKNVSIGRWRRLQIAKFSVKCTFKNIGSSDAMLKQTLQF